MKCFMNTKFRKLLSFLLVFVTVFALIAPSANAASAPKADDVGALWDGYTAGSGTFTVTSDSRVYVIADKAPAGDLLQTVQLIQRQLRANFEGSFNSLVWGDSSLVQQGDITLQLLSTDNKIGADGYKLDVNSTRAAITAIDTDGLIYGANNLIKCFRAVNGKSISGFSGYDSPDTKERTVHLDTARKYYTVEWICNFIRQMSWMGYNALQVHVSEDGGFRGDFWDERYYTDNYHPENDFSWLCGSHLQSWVKDQYRNDPDANKYLTTEELVQICKVAKEYHIEIIPSFDSPAHMDYITWKFEQNYKKNKDYSFTYNGTTYNASSTQGCINYTGRTGYSSPEWPYYTTIDITDGTMSKAFVFAIYEDMADFFKEYAGSTKFNIGADEVNLSSSYGPKWGYSKFPGYVNDLNRMLNSKGYTVRMFNDFIGSTTYNQENSKAVYSFDSNIEICYWTSDYHPTTGDWTEPVWHVKFFWENNNGTSDNWGDGGRTMYNCIQTNTYYVLRVGTDYSKTSDARHPNNRNWTFYHSTEEAIFNEWYPADISEKGVYAEDAADVPDSQLGGAYFLIWNDYAAVSTESEVWNGAPDAMGGSEVYSLINRMWSNTIKMWNSDINKSTVKYSNKTVTYDGTVTYDQFAQVRDTFGFFPGYDENKGCSENNVLPAAAELKAAMPPVDRTALDAAIASAEMLGADAYTPASWTPFENALKTAKSLGDDATQDEINAAATALTNAQNALVKRADKTGLIAALEAALKLKADDHTAGSWNPFQVALATANQVNENGDASEAEIKSATDALTAAQSNLVNIANLKALVNRVPANQGNYTDESWAKVQEELADANAVLANANATESQVNEACGELNRAILDLKENDFEESAEITIRKVANVTPKGKKIGLVVSAPAIAANDSLTVTLNGAQIDLSLCISNVQILNGVETRVWMVNFPATQIGTYNYTVNIANVGAKQIAITVK